MPSSAFKNRSEEHTSELQSHDNLVCRLLLEKINSLNRKISVSFTNLMFLSLHGRRSFLYSRLWRRIALNFFFFNDPATTDIYTLSLHDALPINDTATTEIYTLSLHDVFRSRWSPYH